MSGDHYTIDDASKLQYCCTTTNCNFDDVSKERRESGDVHECVYNSGSWDKNDYRCIKEYDKFIEVIDLPLPEKNDLSSLYQDIKDKKTTIQKVVSKIKLRESKKKVKYKEICNEGKIINVKNNTIIPKNHKVFRKA